jgi:hypothetical protein
MRILLIGATHGNELLGVKLYSYMLRYRSPLLEYVDFMIGNPRAYSLKKRYTEYDLNRCYGVSGDSYEHRRAREIAEYIKTTKPDIVLDMHTTTCTQPNCLIVSNLDGEAKQRFLRASHIATVLQVNPMNDITTLGNMVVGYEVPNGNISPALLAKICDDMERLINGAVSEPKKKLFVMSDKIYKKDVTTEQAKTFVNFEFHSLGFVPIMIGENSYKRQTDYLGFKAEEERHIEV